MAYKNIHENFWRDGDIRTLSSDDQLMLLYLITNHHSHFSGIYHLPKEYIAADLNWTPQKIDRAFENLRKEKIGLSIGLSNDLSKVRFFMKYDLSTSVIWIRTMLKHQITHRKMNSKQFKAVCNHMLSLPFSELLIEFAQYYGQHNALQLPFFDADLLPYHTVSVSEAVSASETEAETVSNIHATDKQRHLDYVLLSDTEHQKLKERLNGKTDDYISRLNNYIGQIGVKAAAEKYRSHYHTILNWHAKDQEKPQSGQGFGIV